MASNTAVTMALPSVKNGLSGLHRSFNIAASLRRATVQAKPILIKTPGPKKTVSAAIAGNNANNNWTI